jgi:tRNA U55 pseudouridine synthase TruB
MFVSTPQYYFQILFIGKAVRTLNRGNDIKMIKTHHARAFVNTLSRTSSKTSKNGSNMSLQLRDGVDEEDDDDEDSDEEDEGVIGLTKTEIDEYEMQYNKLAHHSKFQLLQFESLIRRQHQSVAERLWRLVVIKGNLFDHLQVLLEREMRERDVGIICTYI